MGDNVELTPATVGAGSWVRDALRGARSPAARRAATAITVGLAAWETGRKVQAWANDRVLYTVAVPGSDEMYDTLHEWLVSQVPSARRRSIVALSRRRENRDRLLVSPEGDSPVPTMRTMRQIYDGSRPQTVRIGGHRVQVGVEQDSRAAGLTLTVSDRDWLPALQRIVFRCTGVAARDAVLEFLAELTAREQAARPTPRMWVATRWGEWRRVRDVPPRPLDTVILADGQLDRILDDLTTFFALEEAYARVGMPWHRGYLFHGAPGTGKTSTAKAIAERFDLDVYYLPLSDLEHDTNLLQLLGGVDPRSMLLIEDVDVVHGARARDDAETKGVSTSGLLNALDGFTTPHGLISVMTTNDLAVLDPALVRPGRADVVEEFGLLDDNQAGRLGRLVGTDEPLPHLKGVALTHAELLEAAKPHLGDPTLAHKALVHRIYEARSER